jgi:hypothetical protein
MFLQANALSLFQSYLRRQTQQFAHCRGECIMLIPMALTHQNHQVPLRGVGLEVTTVKCSKTPAGNAAYKNETETVKEWMRTTLGREHPTAGTLVPMARDIVIAGIRTPYHILQALARAVALREQYIELYTSRISRWNLTRKERDALVEDNQRHIHFCGSLKEAQKLFVGAVQTRALISMASQCPPERNVWSNTAVTAERICRV